MDNTKCQCGCGMDITKDFKDMIEIYDDECDVKISKRITSGARCEKHNKKVGGATLSAHKKGLAVDVRVDNSWERHRILEVLFKHDVPRIGIGKTFIHFDHDEDLPKEVAWLY